MELDQTPSEVESHESKGTLFYVAKNTKESMGANRTWEQLISKVK